MTTPKWTSCKLITEIYLQDDLKFSQRSRWRFRSSTNVTRWWLITFWRI